MQFIYPIDLKDETYITQTLVILMRLIQTVSVLTVCVVIMNEWFIQFQITQVLFFFSLDTARSSVKRPTRKPDA